MTTAHLTLLRPKHAPVEHLERVVPGFTRQKLAQLFAERGYHRGAEIGVAGGRYSRVLCDEIPNLQLLCVDPWHAYLGNPRGGKNDRHAKNYADAQALLVPFAVTFRRGYSVEVAATIPDGSLDFVFIDGNHEYDYVKADLRAWSPKVCSGGIVAGHDFYVFPLRPAGVLQAVTEFIAEHGITDWHICDEREPSFWWVKP